jgi:hypothetical protein
MKNQKLRGNNVGQPFWPTASACQSGPATEPAGRPMPPASHRAQHAGGGVVNAGGSGDEVEIHQRLGNRGSTTIVEGKENSDATHRASREVMRQRKWASATSYNTEVERGR